MFYIVSPDELALGPDDVAPNYILNPWHPHVFCLHLYRVAVCSSTRGRRPRVKQGSNPSQALARQRHANVNSSRRYSNFSEVVIECLGLYLTLGVYGYVYENFRLTTVDVPANKYFAYVVLMLGKDYGYYWFHRVVHEYHILWTAHSVHHSGEDYNLACGLRQGALQSFMSWPFYIPLAFLGFNPAAFKAHAQLNTLFMFYIHTDVIGRLPFGLEYIFNTPTAHRLHHRPPGNCNYAGMFIIWDKIHGTYIPERVRKDHYGLAKQPQTFDPLKLNMNHFRRMAADVGRGRSWLYRLTARRVPWRFKVDFSALFKPMPELKKDIRDQGPIRKKWNGEQEMSLATTIVVAACTLATIVGMLVLLLSKGSMHNADVLVAGVIALLLLSSFGRIWDNRKGEVEWAAASAAVLLPAFFAAIKVQPARTYFNSTAA